MATLVENAVKHGLAQRACGGSIRVSAARQGAMLELVVVDDGVGLQADAAGGTGIGLYNVRARLATLYGTHGSLLVQANIPSGVCARIRLPLRLETA
jgi:LytS/YehU family sensor histidine kinase